MELFLIDLSRDLKYFEDVELVFPLDKFQVCSIFNMFTENSNKSWLPVAKTEPGFVLVFCEYMDDPTNLKFYSAWKRAVLVSAHAQNFYS